MPNIHYLPDKPSNFLRTENFTVGDNKKYLRCIYLSLQNKLLEFHHHSIDVKSITNFRRIAGTGLAF
jgi:hypothetical protein